MFRIGLKPCFSLSALILGLWVAIGANRMVVHADVDHALIAPELIPSGPIQPVVGGCKQKYRGKSGMSLVIDATGRPKDIIFTKPDGTDFDRLALKLIEDDSFKPGSQGGVPVGTRAEIEVSAEVCYSKVDGDPKGQERWILQLKSPAVQKLSSDVEQYESNTPENTAPYSSEGSSERTNRVGNGVSRPEVIHSVEAGLPHIAGPKKIQGTCLVSLIVDAHGLPQKIRVVKSLQPDYDQSAIIAVNQYRFKPALKDDGEPVAVPIHLRSVLGSTELRA